VPRATSRTYEAVYIFDSALEDAAIGEKLQKLPRLLTPPRGHARALGAARQLAYPIKRARTATT
jgi:small subunit ribosomal protein S6